MVARLSHRFSGSVEVITTRWGARSSRSPGGGSEATNDACPNAGAEGSSTTLAATAAKHGTRTNLIS